MASTDAKPAAMTGRTTRQSEKPIGGIPIADMLPDSVNLIMSMIDVTANRASHAEATSRQETRTRAKALIGNRSDKQLSGLAPLTLARHVLASQGEPLELLQDPF